MRRDDNLPHIRTVDALQGSHTGDTKALFRALSEADDWIHAREQRDEATVRLQELEAENRDLRAENVILKTKLDNTLIPPRSFVDDRGWRWEWCGGTPTTWAWRRTGRGQPDHNV